MQEAMCWGTTWGKDEEGMHVGSRKKWTVRLLEETCISQIYYSQVLPYNHTGSTFMKVKVLGKIVQLHEQVIVWKGFPGDVLYDNKLYWVFLYVTNQSFWNGNCHYHLMTGHRQMLHFIGVALPAPTLRNWYFTHAWRLAHSGKSHIVLICCEDTVQHFSISPLSE